MRRIVWTAASVLVLVAASLGIAYAAGAFGHSSRHAGLRTVARPRAIDRGPIARGPNTGPHALLTFDDCPYGPWTGSHDSPTPPPTTPAAAWTRFRATIATAERLRVALVLAPTGECEARYRAALGVDVAAYARAHGMWVIGHSYDHTRFPHSTVAQLDFQLDHAVPSYWVRPPYGAYDPLVGLAMRATHHSPWTWTVSSHDFEGLSAATVTRTIISACTTGQTCLLHMQWAGFDPAVLSRMVTGMEARGTRECALQTTGRGAVVPTPVAWVRLSCDPRRPVVRRPHRHRR